MYSFCFVQIWMWTIYITTYIFFSGFAFVLNVLLLFLHCCRVFQVFHLFSEFDLVLVVKYIILNICAYAVECKSNSVYLVFKLYDKKNRKETNYLSVGILLILNTFDTIYIIRLIHVLPSLLHLFKDFCTVSLIWFSYLMMKSINNC